MGDKSPGKIPGRLRVNHAIFDYCVSLIEAGKALGDKDNLTPWDVYNEWLEKENIKTQADLDAMVQKYGGEDYLLPRSRRKRQAGKVLNYRVGPKKRGS